MSSRTESSGDSGGFDAFFRRLLRDHGYSWAGYRKVRKGVHKRIARRVRALGLAGLDDYARRLERDPEELSELPVLLAVTISRFFRDREAWAHLARVALPHLPRIGDSPARAMSLGCASGEEPYTLRILWHDSGREEPLDVLGLDLLPECLERAERGVYPPSALRDVPLGFLERYFEREGEDLRVAERARQGIRFAAGNYLDPGSLPSGFGLVLCRNGPFTYLEPCRRGVVLEQVRESLLPGGFLMIGSNESLPIHPRRPPESPPDDPTRPAVEDPGFEDLGRGVFRRGVSGVA